MRRKKVAELNEKKTSPAVKHGGGWTSGTGNISLVEGRMDSVHRSHRLLKDEDGITG